MKRGVVRKKELMKVGKDGKVKEMYMEKVKEIGEDIIIGNKYKMMMRKGEERVERIGGMKEFGGWKGKIMND